MICADCVVVSQPICRLQPLRPPFASPSLRRTLYWCRPRRRRMRPHHLRRPRHRRSSRGGTPGSQRRRRQRLLLLLPPPRRGPLTFDRPRPSSRSLSMHHRVCRPVVASPASMRLFATSCIRPSHRITLLPLPPRIPPLTCVTSSVSRPVPLLSPLLRRNLLLHCTTPRRMLHRLQHTCVYGPIPMLPITRRDVIR
jgi:hypothetical protein